MWSSLLYFFLYQITNWEDCTRFQLQPICSFKKDLDIIQRTSSLESLDKFINFVGRRNVIPGARPGYWMRVLVYSHIEKSKWCREDKGTFYSHSIYACILDLSSAWYVTMWEIISSHRSERRMPFAVTLRKSRLLNYLEQATLSDLMIFREGKLKPHWLFLLWIYISFCYLKHSINIWMNWPQSNHHWTLRKRVLFNQRSHSQMN